MRPIGELCILGGSHCVLSRGSMAAVLCALPCHSMHVRLKGPTNSKYSNDDYKPQTILVMKPSPHHIGTWTSMGARFAKKGAGRARFGAMLALFRHNDEGLGNLQPCFSPQSGRSF